MFLAGVFGKRNVSFLDLEISFPEEMYANKTTFIKIKVINKRRFFPAFLIRILIKDFNVSYLFPYFEKSAYATLKIKPEKRGFHTLKEVYIISVFPFNFFVRWKKLSKNFSYIVFPEPKKINLFSYRDRKGRGDIDTEKTGFEGDILSIKDYTEGIPAKYIHWKATARFDEPKVKELSELSNQPVIIEFEKIKISNIELKLSYLTYLIIELIKRGKPVGLKIKKKFYKPDLSYKHKLTLLTELALYE